jgi:hypothetical protein
MLNPFFLNGSSGEQNLIQSLVNEQLKMYGIEIYYIPRRYLKKNTVIKEVIQSEFTSAYPIEAYVDNYDGYGGQGTLLSKFGIQNNDDLTLIVSKERYETYITPLTENLPNIELATRPKEGDLVYFPLGDRLFEIKYVEHEQPFYQLQKNYVYQLRCELFRYEDEVLDTGVETIDDEIEQIGYIQTLTLLAVGISTIATGTANMCEAGSVQRVAITNAGVNYTSAPIVAFSSAPAGGVTATGIASVSNAYIGCDGQDTGKVISINITNAGCGYTVPPIITIQGGGGTGAAATAGIVTTKSVQYISVASSGAGYLTAPTVGISTPRHVGAAATAVLDVPSLVGAGVSVIAAPISIGASAYLFPYGTTGGVYYRTAPTVTFDAPTGSGDNARGEAFLDTYHLTGGTVKNIAITTEGKFYTSAPSVSLSHPGFSYASATIDIGGGDDGSSIDPSTVAFTTTGRAYTTAPNVLIGLGTGTDVTQVAVGIATIAPITGFVTAVGFNTQTDPWCVGTGATVGAGYTVRPTISFSGNTGATLATATATVSVAGTVTSISVGNSGYGYVSAPTVYIAAPSGGGSQFTATGIATIRYDSIKTEGTVGIGSNVITGINTSGMIVGDRVRVQYGYDSTYARIRTFPPETFIVGLGTDEITVNNTSTNVGLATTSIEVGIQNCGIVTGITVTYGGGGYLFPPTVTISNEVAEKNYADEVSGVTQAVGITTINSNGNVTQVYLTDSGAKYVIPPDITFSEPIAGIITSSGSFIFNEIITGGTSGTTARVKEYDAPNNTLEISIVDGAFVAGETITGSDSGAVHIVKGVNNDDLVTPYADNDTIELEADSIINFSKSNPFGMP